MKNLDDAKQFCGFSERLSWFVLRFGHPARARVRPWIAVCLGILVAASPCRADPTTPACPLKQPLTLKQRIDLANRFRPFIMTSLDGGEPEPYRPTTWQTFVGTTEIHQGYVGRYCLRLGGALNLGSTDDWPEGSAVYAGTPPSEVTQQVLAQHPEIILELPHGNVSGINNGLINPGYAMHVTSPDDRHGEEWQTVLTNGDGIYAHVEQVTDLSGNLSDFINIEYTILWSYNQATCDAHSGDITTMVVLYNSATGLISRVSYAPHDYALETFLLADPSDIDFYPLQWQDLSGKIESTAAVALTVPDEHQYQQGGFAHGPGVPVIYLVADPETGRFEHPVAVAETGGHELWPNTSGTMTEAGAHYGDGISFLPAVATGDPDSKHPTGMQMLERDDQTDINAPFVYFNGLIGTDPNPPMLHFTWYWPEGRAQNCFNIPDDRFSGSSADPYKNLSADKANIPWPPAADYANESTTAYVGGAISQPAVYALSDLAAQPLGRQGVDTKFNAQAYYPTARFDDPFHPFEDIMQAFSLVPCGGTIAIRPGKYFLASPLQRSCMTVGSKPATSPITLTAPNGGVTISKTTAAQVDGGYATLVLSK